MACTSRAFRARQVALILDHLERRARPKLILSLIGRQGLLLQVPRFDGRVIAGARLLQSDHRVLHVHADLVDVLLQGQFVLPELQSGW